MCFEKGALIERTLASRKRYAQTLVFKAVAFQVLLVAPNGVCNYLTKGVTKNSETRMLFRDDSDEPTEYCQHVRQHSETQSKYNEPGEDLVFVFVFGAG